MLRSEEPKNQPKLEIVLVVVATVIILAPFIFKPIHLDDPVYIWAALNILKNPFNFYGSQMNWLGFEAPTYALMMSPPLVCYYIALVILFFGSSEVALHIAFIIPAIGVSIGTYFLAKEFSTKPLPAVLVSIVTPAFLVSGTTIMCDVMMLAFWVWAVFFWVRGINRNRPLLLLISAILIFFSIMSKYFGVCLIPLLFLYALIQKRRIGHWLFYLIIAASLFLLYEWSTYYLYGECLLFQASSYAYTTDTSSSLGEKFLKLVVGLSFTGGGIISILFVSPFLWSRRSLVIGFVSFAVITMMLYVLVYTGSNFEYFNRAQEGLLVQIVIYATCGLLIIILSVEDIYRNRDVGSILLFLWVVGTFIFATYINWTTHIRVILPIVPAFGILTARRLDRREKGLQSCSLNKFYFSLVPALSLALLISWADYTLARTAKEAAIKISLKYAQQGHKIWFQGHWGFQYYMQIMGAIPLDKSLPAAMPGDLIIVPYTNSNLWDLNEKYAKPIEILQFQPFKWLTTNSLEASFYTSMWGPVPYQFGVVPSDTYFVFIVNPKRT